MKPFTQDQFAHDVVAEVRKECRCSVPGFQKLISFNFQDYDTAPTLLWDAEILIHEIIRNGFDALDDGVHQNGEWKRRYRCPGCGRACTESYCDFNISSYRSFVLFDEDLRAPHAEYVLGFRALDAKPFDKISDFSRATDFDAYLASLTIAER